jgi:hypothetical protein
LLRCSYRQEDRLKKTREVINQLIVGGPPDWLMATKGTVRLKLATIGAEGVEGAGVLNGVDTGEADGIGEVELVG